MKLQSISVLRRCHAAVSLYHRGPCSARAAALGTSRERGFRGRHRHTPNVALHPPLNHPSNRAQSDWRGAPAVLADVPRLSRYVHRALDAEAGHGSAADIRLELLGSLAAAPLTAESLRAELD